MFAQVNSQKLTEIQNKSKVYTGTITLGATTPSYDLETKPNNNYATHHINENLILDASKQFVGEINQKPPIFSALKKDGERLYKKARRGEKIEVKSRKIYVHNFKIHSIKGLNVNFEIKNGG